MIPSTNSIGFHSRTFPKALVCHIAEFLQPNETPNLICARSLKTIINLDFWKKHVLKAYPSLVDYYKRQNLMPSCVHWARFALTLSRLQIVFPIHVHATLGIDAAACDDQDHVFVAINQTDVTGKVYEKISGRLEALFDYQGTAKDLTIQNPGIFVLSFKDKPKATRQKTADLVHPLFNDFYAVTHYSKPFSFLKIFHRSYPEALGKTKFRGIAAKWIPLSSGKVFILTRAGVLLQLNALETSLYQCRPIPILEKRKREPV